MWAIVGQANEVRYDLIGEFLNINSTAPTEQYETALMWAIVGRANEVVYDLREGFLNIKSTAPTEQYKTAQMWAIVGQANEVVYDLRGGFLNNKSCLGRHKANISHDCTECVLFQGLLTKT